MPASNNNNIKLVLNPINNKVMKVKKVHVRATVRVKKKSSRRRLAEKIAKKEKTKSARRLLSLARKKENPNILVSAYTRQIKINV